MYLNKLKIGSQNIVCNLCLGFAGIVYFVFLLLFACSFNIIKNIESSAVPFLVLEIIVLMIALPFTLIPLSVKRRLYRAAKYNRIFEEDYDGMVSYETFSKLTGFSGSMVRNDIRIMTENGIFRNITYGFAGAMVIMKPSTETDFVTVYCPNCGAAVNMRKTGGARCDHCGTYIRTEA
jgi:hypothetical protein